MLLIQKSWGLSIKLGGGELSADKSEMFGSDYRLLGAAKELCDGQKEFVVGPG